MNANPLINKIAESIHQSDGNAQAYLFGSRARGNFRPDSDWDILILVDEEHITNEIEDKFRDKLYALEISSNQIISTFIYPKNHWNHNMIYSPLYKAVKKEGIKI